KPAWAATFRGLDALAVDDTRRRGDIASNSLASARDQNAIDPAPNSSITPVVEVILNGRARRKVLGHSSPLAPRRQNVEDRVHHRAELQLSGPTWAAALCHQRRNPPPLRVRHIVCITQGVAPILISGDFSPRHCDLHRISQIRRNHKGLKSLNSFSARL